jgi:hypothetical protein
MNIQTETVIQSYIDSASRSTLACLCNVNVQTAFVTNYPSLQMQPQDCNSKRQSTKCRSALAYNESVIVSHQRNAHDLPQEPEPGKFGSVADVLIATRVLEGSSTLSQQAFFQR